MGVAITKLLEPERTTLGELAHRIIAVDAFNMLYQFITTIRMRDGTPLKNSKGQTTSHLVGLFSRTTTMLEGQLKLIFVFDGETPKLKQAERARRKAVKEDAKEKHAQAVAEKNVDAMRKYSGRTATLTTEMIQEAKQLLDALGVPWIQAPAEGEAQAAHMVRKGDADYVGSQDMDCLLFGAPRTIKNLSSSGKRKRPGTAAYTAVHPEIYVLEKQLAHLGLTQKQLIALGMLIGTDFNPGGVKGLGPKKGIKLVKQHGEDLETLFTEVAWDEHCEYDWQTVYDTIVNMPVTDEYEINWNAPDEQAVKKLLVDEFEFSTERVENALAKLAVSSKQKGLRDFF